MPKDLYNNLSGVQSLKPAARTATANGTGVDLFGYESALVVYEIGTCTDGTHTFSVDESADNSTFTAVAAGDLQGTAPAVITTNDEQVYTQGYKGIKRYIRTTVTVSGATTGLVSGTSIIRGDKKYKP